MSTTNVLKALNNLASVTNFSLPSHYSGPNRVNNAGVALEYFVKDAFCNSLSVNGISAKDREYGNHLSYIGNSNNPPDFMIRGGDAVEVKKIQSFNSGLALNSSYPKDIIYSDSPFITEACRKCEQWKEKDIIYVVGVVKNKEIKLLWFVYGDCYAASKEVYEKTRDKVIEGVKAAKGLKFSNTKELGRINEVDPLRITYLRIRGMWGIENPTKVFADLGIDQNKVPSIAAIMKKEKYLSFPETDRRGLESKGAVKEDEIKDPNNPANFLKVKVIEL